MDNFWVKNESKVPDRIREGDVVRAKSNRTREGNCRRFQGRRKGKEKSFCFIVVQFELIFCHPWFYVVCACTEFFGEAGHFTERSRFLELCVICEKLMVYRVVSCEREREREAQCTGRRELAPVLSPEAHRTLAVMVTKTSYLLKRTDICLRGMTETTGMQ